MFITKINSVAELRRGIAIAEQLAPHRVPLLRGLLNGTIAHMELQHTTTCSAFKRWAGLARLPAVALIGADFSEACGPEGWAAARHTLAWSRFTVVHAAGGQSWSYDNALDLAQQAGRVLIIECSSPALPSWGRAFDRWATSPHGLVIRPRPGEAHPVFLGGGGFH